MQKVLIVAATLILTGSSAFAQGGSGSSSGSDATTGNTAGTNTGGGMGSGAQGGSGPGGVVAPMSGGVSPSNAPGTPASATTSGNAGVPPIK